MEMIWNFGTSYDQYPLKNLYSIREFWLDLPSHLTKHATLQWNGQLVQKSQTPALITPTKLGLNLVDVAATKVEKDGAASNGLLKTNNKCKYFWFGEFTISV